MSLPLPALGFQLALVTMASKRQPCKPKPSISTWVRATTPTQGIKCPPILCHAHMQNLLQEVKAIHFESGGGGQGFDGTRRAAVFLFQKQMAEGSSNLEACQGQLARREWRWIVLKAHRAAK